jgi:hypothetical protein
VSSGQSVINRFVDLRIGALQIKPPDPDLSGRRFGGHGCLVSSSKAILQEIHAFHYMLNISAHRANRIQMLWLNRKHAL